MSITLVPFDSPIECTTIDTETTGLDPFDGDEILTLAMVLDIEHRESPSSVHLRVKPQHKTEWPAAERVNHISPDSVANHKPFKNYLEAVQSLFDRAEKIVGWNVGFDLGFLEHEGVIIPQTAEIVDAMEEFGAYTAHSQSPIQDGGSPLRQMPWDTASRALRIPHLPMPWLQGVYISTRLQLPRA